MERRDFIKTSAIIGGLATTVGTAASCSSKEPVPEKIDYMQEEKLNVSLLHEFENEFLKVKISSDASTEIFDKKTGEKWQMGKVTQQEYGPIDEGFVWTRGERMMCEQYP